MNNPARLVQVILAELKKQPAIYMIGLAGIPGSGKTTLAQELAFQVPGAVVVPMDGYHIPRARLDADGLRRRGAPHTFDADIFRTDIEMLHRNRSGIFPTFDHATKDPLAGAIRVTADAPLVIVEGLYVLMQDWRLENLFDLRVFLDCDFDEAVNRLIARHMQTGVAATAEEARHRALTSDRMNTEDVLADGCRERAHLIFSSGC